jgi:hypothetical protein
MAHRTVSGPPGRATLQPATLGFLLGALRYNSLDCPMCTGNIRRANGATVTWRQRSTAKGNSTPQKSAQRSQSASDMSGVAPTVRCNYKTKDSNGRLLQTPNGVLTWRAPNSEQYLSSAPPDCPVYPSPAKPANG